MGRGLPWSVLLHVFVLVAVVFYGNAVTRRPVRTPRTIHVSFARPEPEQPPAVEQEALSDPVPPAPEEVAPELPPKEVPETRPDPTPEPEQKPEPVAEEPAAEPAAAVAEPMPTLSGPAVGGTDTDFPFAWYLSRVQGLIARNWRPRQMGFGERTRVRCVVHFVIARTGAVSQVTMDESSGVGVYDREALRAVQTTRLPALPPQYGGSTLGVTFIFNLEPGH